MRENGKYVVTRYMNHTGALIKGIGVTVEAARKDLKANLKLYREALAEGKYLIPTGRGTVARLSVAVQIQNELKKKAEIKK